MDEHHKNLQGTKIVYHYLGKDRSGYLRLRAADEELLIVGTLYAVPTPTKRPANGPRKILLVSLHTSPGYVRERTQDSTFTVTIATGEKLRVIGRIVNARKLQLEVKKQHPLPAVPLVSKTVESARLPTTKPSRKPSKEQQFSHETKRVTDLAAMGHDPEVRMTFVHQFIGMSQSNLYKKIQAGEFPSPSKRGSSAHWKFSTLRAYQDGTWQPSAT